MKSPTSLKRILIGLTTRHHDSPELNPIERLWAYLKSHYLSNRVFIDYDELFAAVGQARWQLDESCLRSITHTAWLTPADEVRCV